MENFSEFVKSRKKTLGLTYHEMAEALGVNWVTLWRWCNNHAEPRYDAKEYWIEKIENLKNNGKAKETPHE